MKGYVLLRAMRVHQWVKNVLVFVPLVMAHLLSEWHAISSALLAFASFSLVASSVYITNDILDRESDRLHPTKRNRPIASGALSISVASALTALLVMLSFVLAFRLPSAFVLCLAVYLLVTFLYSTVLKRMVIADIIVLAALYALRILAGGYAAEVHVSQWLLAFSMFFFLSLACLKRFSELRLIDPSRQDSPGPQGRGYLFSDLPQVSQLGTACGCLSVLVFALYISSKDVSQLYSKPNILWLACPVLFYWLSRIWILAERGRVHEDPILFAVGDGQSYLTGVFLVFVFFLAV